MDQIPSNKESCLIGRSLRETIKGRKPRLSLRLSGVFLFILESPPLSELPPFKRVWLSMFEAAHGNGDSFRYFIANSLACINTPRYPAKNGNPRQLQTRRFSFSGEPAILKDSASLARQNYSGFSQRSKILKTKDPIFLKRKRPRDESQGCQRDHQA